MFTTAVRYSLQGNPAMSAYLPYGLDIHRRAMQQTLTLAEGNTLAGLTSDHK